MIDGLEARLIEALKSVDAHGDVAPAHVHDPMTMLLRENAIQANHHDGGQSPPMMKGACGCLWGRVPVRETSSERSLLVWRSHPDS
jgi:hypothetical protein